MALSEIDRNLLERCLQRKSPGLGGLRRSLHGPGDARHQPHGPSKERPSLGRKIETTSARRSFWPRSRTILPLLRNFRGQASLATYLTVVARRIVVKELLAQDVGRALGRRSGGEQGRGGARPAPAVEERLGDHRGGRAAAGRAARTPRPRWCACTISKARATRKSARRSGCPKTASAPSLAVPATRCAAPASIRPPVDGYRYTNGLIISDTEARERIWWAVTIGAIASLLWAWFSLPDGPFSYFLFVAAISLFPMDRKDCGRFGRGRYVLLADLRIKTIDNLALEGCGTLGGRNVGWHND